MEAAACTLAEAIPADSVTDPDMDLDTDLATDMDPDPDGDTN